VLDGKLYCPTLPYCGQEDVWYFVACVLATLHNDDEDNNDDDDDVDDDAEVKIIII